MPQTPATAEQFRKQLLERLDELEFLSGYEPDEQVWEEAAIFVRKAGVSAAELQMPDLYRRSSEIGEYCSTAAAKQFLADCLAALPRPQRLLLTLDEVADLLQVSTRSIARYKDSGRMPAPLKVGGKLRWNRADLQKWIDSGCKRVRPLRRRA